MDVLAVYDAAQEAVARVRAGQDPTLVECETYRYVGHSRSDLVTIALRVGDVAG